MSTVKRLSYLAVGVLNPVHFLMMNISLFNPALKKSILYSWNPGENGKMDPFLK